MFMDIHNLVKMHCKTNAKLYSKYFCFEPLNPLWNGTLAYIYIKSQYNFLLLSGPGSLMCNEYADWCNHNLFYNVALSLWTRVEIGISLFKYSRSQLCPKLNNIESWSGVFIDKTILSFINIVVWFSLTSRSEVMHICAGKLGRH